MSLLVTLLVLGYVRVENLKEETVGFVRNARQSALQNKWTNKHEYTLLLNERDKCKGGDVLLLVAVLSAPGNLEMRETIRKTYGSVKEYKGSSLRVIFLLGSSANESVNNVNPRIKQESETYHDIIKGDFIDHYDNLTYKTVLGLHWVHNYCREAQYVLKIDDDTILNVYKVLYFLQDLWKNHHNSASKFLYCKTMEFIRPVRKTIGKNYVSYNEYPYPLYPQSCNGPGYLFSGDTALALYEASKKVPFLSVEDVFIAFCAKTAGVPIIDNFFGFYMDIYGEKFKFYWPTDWVLLIHFNRDSNQWYELWNSSLSSPIQHSQIYYQILKIFIIIVFIAAISMFSFCRRKKLKTLPPFGLNKMRI